MKGKLRNLKKFLISTLMMTVVLLVGATTAIAAPFRLEMKASGSGPIWFDDGTVGNWYCREKGKPAVFLNEANEVIETTEYELMEEDMQIEPMTGYAFYKLYVDGDECGTWTKQALQCIIWSSKHLADLYGFDCPTVVEEDSIGNWWSDTASSTPLADEEDKNGDGIVDTEQWEEILIWAEQMSGLKTPEELEEWYGEYDAQYEPSEFFLRIQQYGRVQYGIFQRSVEGLLYKYVENDDLMVLVDQIDGTYTVGPYTMTLTCDDSHNGEEDFEKAKLALYQELIGEGNVGYTEANCFTKEIEIEGLNKKEGTDVKLINAQGEEIKFPNFKAYDGTTNETEEFYFRFVPDNDGQIEHTGDPVIRIKYLFDFADCIVQRYKLEKISDIIAIGDAKSLKEAVYKIFDNWYEFNIIKKLHILGDGKYEYIYSVTGDLQFHDIKVKIHTTHGHEVEVPVDDFEIHFGQDNNSYTTETYQAEWIPTPTEDDPNDGYWNYPWPTEVKADAPADVKASLYAQCKVVIDEKEIEYEYEDQDGDLADYVQKCSLLGDSKYNDGFHLVLVEAHWKECEIEFPGVGINEKLGGHVWLEGKGIKTAEFDGKYNDLQDIPYAGMQVTLYEQTNLTDEVGHPFQYEGVKNPTVTDKNGEYKFEHLNPLKKYYVEFLYNGEYYQSTYFKYNISGNYSNAMDVDREGFNDRFDQIEADPEAYNYEGWHAAYAKESRLMKTDGSFIAGGYSPKAEYRQINYESQNYHEVLLYMDAWEFFRDAAVDEGSYEAAYQKLYNWLTGEKGVDPTEAYNVVEFTKHCMIKSTTKVKDPLNNFKCELQDKVVYPVYNQFVLKDEENPPEEIKTVILDKTFYYLYTKPSDQSRWVDYGIAPRIETNLVLQKDVYKATVFLNGQKEEYFYNQQPTRDQNGVWTVTARASDVLYNGRHAYRKFMKASDVLVDHEATYNGMFAGNQNYKNLDVLVTYRIDIANFGDTVASVDEIVDYYDANHYVVDGSLNGGYDYKPTVYTEYKDSGEGEACRDYYYINANIARNAFSRSEDYSKKKSDGTNISSGYTLSKKSTQHRDPKDEELVGSNYKYEPVYITLNNREDSVLQPGGREVLSIFVTFKATDPTKNIENVKGIDLLDQDLNTGKEKVGKLNIAEINGYSTTYKEGEKIPDHLNNDDSTVDKIVSGKKAGIIDYNSKAGSLAKVDLTEDGLIKDADQALPDAGLTNRLEDDTCSAPPFKLLIDTNKDNVRRVKGYTFEDARTETEKNEGKTKVGDGVYKNGSGDVKINGVTIQLVELVRDVDELNQFSGKYLGEYIWGEEIYNLNGTCIYSSLEDYWSGTNSSRVVIRGEGIFDVQPETLNENEGEYAFTSLPAGDFFIRFIYGDTYRTVLTNGTDESKIQLGDEEGNVKDYKLGELETVVNNLVGTSGMNAKSYNGQDYKSTVYQSKINQNPLIVNGQQIDNYHGITRYTDVNGKNYINSYDADKRGINRPTDDYSVSELWKLSGPVNNMHKEYMYMYNVGTDYVESDNKTHNLSDAKDVYSYRERANQYSTTMQNYKAEVLSSFERIVTSGNADDQKNKLGELMNNTYMVAQSGIMDLEIEQDTLKLENLKDSSEGDPDLNYKEYHIEDVDFGLVERPEAGLKIKKEVSRFQVVLANGETLFDTDKSVNNVFFAKHVGHITGYENYRMKKPEIGDNRKASPRIIQVYMDDEIMTGSKVTITYKYTVTNVGEVDYTSKEFYYKGTKASDDSVVRTASTVVADYLTNYLKYQSTYQENPNAWVVTSVENLIPSSVDASKVPEDFINNKYLTDAKSYNSILTTNVLANNSKNEFLLPEVYNKDESTATATLIAGTTISGDATVDGLLYNNLAEIVQVQNTVGRRMQYSRVGNQPIANQNYGDDTDKKYNTAFDLVTPTEIDADSAQLVRILPPTGANKKYSPIILTCVAVVMIIGISVIIIRKKVLNSNTK